MQINFNDVDLSKTFTVYDKGPYTVRIKSIEDVQSSAGNPQLRIKTEIQTPEGFQGKQLTEHITLVASCDWKIGKFLAGCGVDVKKLGVLDTNSGAFRGILNKLINKTTVWVVGQKTDNNGQLRNEILDYQPDPNANNTIEAEEDTPEFLQEAKKDADW